MQVSADDSSQISVFSTKYGPIASTTMRVRLKQSIASSGEQTIGSFFIEAGIQNHGNPGFTLENFQCGGDFSPPKLESGTQFAISVQDYFSCRPSPDGRFRSVVGLWRQANLLGLGAVVRFNSVTTAHAALSCGTTMSGSRAF